MSVKITYFVHGTTMDNEHHISSGWSDVELSERGIQESLSLGEKVKNTHFDIVFSSDLRRAVHSAELAFGGHVPIAIDARLRECNYGDFNGQLSKIVEPLQEKSITQRFKNGESYEDVKKRIEDFLSFLNNTYDGKSVAIVAHKAPQLALDVILSGKSWEQAFHEDWRITGSWQPGWEYILESSL